MFLPELEEGNGPVEDGPWLTRAVVSIRVGLPILAYSLFSQSWQCGP